MQGSVKSLIAGSARRTRRALSPARCGGPDRQLRGHAAVLERQARLEHLGRSRPLQQLGQRNQAGQQRIIERGRLGHAGPGGCCGGDRFGRRRVARGGPRRCPAARGAPNQSRAGRSRTRCSHRQRRPASADAQRRQRTRDRPGSVGSAAPSHSSPSRPPHSWIAMLVLGVDRSIPSGRIGIVPARGSGPTCCSTQCARSRQRRCAVRRPT